MYGFLVLRFFKKVGFNAFGFFDMSDIFKSGLIYFNHNWKRMFCLKIIVQGYNYENILN